MFGDQVLQHVAHMVKNSVRGGDIAARIGGDEFLLFIEYKGDIKALARRIFDALHGNYKSFPIRVSMGIALAPQDGNAYETLFHAADRALYAAKKRGRDRYCFYDSSMQDLLSVLSSIDN